MTDKKFLNLTDEYGNDVIVSIGDVETVRRCVTDVTQISMTNGRVVYVTQQPNDIWDIIEPGSTEKAIVKVTTEEVIGRRRKR